jgi:hypothetical protein
MNGQMGKKMNSEQVLLDKWRSLTSERQQEVLDFVKFIWQKSTKDKPSRGKAVYLGFTPE